jgi:hypothetical protein
MHAGSRYSHASLFAPLQPRACFRLTSANAPVSRLVPDTYTRRTSFCTHRYLQATLLHFVPFRPPKLILLRCAPHTAEPPPHRPAPSRCVCRHDARRRGSHVPRPPGGALRASRRTVRRRTTADSTICRPLHCTLANRSGNHTRHPRPQRFAPFRSGISKLPRLPMKTFVRSREDPSRPVTCGFVLRSGLA